MRLVIGIGGLKRSGKDEFAKALLAAAVEQKLAYPNSSLALKGINEGWLKASWPLCTQYSYTVAFADALRETTAAAYGVPVHEFTDDKLKDAVHPEWGITRRDMLIAEGVPAVLLPPKGADHWVFRWQRTVKGLGDAVVVAPDLRRTNEAAAVHELGVNILINRSGVEWQGSKSAAYLTEKLSDLATQKWRSFGQLYTYGDAERDGLSAAGQRHSKPVFDLVVNNASDLQALQRSATLALKAVLDARPD